MVGLRRTAAAVALAVASLGTIGTVSLVSATPSGASSPTCTDNWLSPVSGLWTTAADWSTGVVPTSSDNACIKVAGTYTVTLKGTEDANTLTLGGTSGKETLTVVGNAAGSAILDLTANGSTITSHGLFSLDSQSVTGASYAEVEGGSNPNVSLKNSGTFETLGATIEPDYIGVDLTNDGTVSIAGASTEENTYATVVNEGSFTVTSSGNLTESNSGSDTSFTQQSGTLVNDGKMVFVGATFTQSGGTESGNPVQLTQFSSLIDSAGSGKFTVTGNGSLTGTIPVGQSITVVGHTTSGALTLVGNVTNDGTLTLKDKSTSVSAELSNGSVSGTTLINNGTFKTKGAAGEADDIDADLTNDSGGTVAISAALTNEVAYANITNNGTFTIGSSGALDETGGSEASTTFTQSGGTLSNTGTILLNSATFTESGGAETGNPVELTDFSSLVDSAGAGACTLMNNASLSGTIPAGQTITVLGDTAEGFGSANLATNVTNDGTLTLNSEDSGDYAQIYAESSSTEFTNDGTFDTTASNGGDDVINAVTTNAAGGTTNIGALTHADAYQDITNNGTFNVTATGDLAASGGSEAATNFTNGGTVDNQGTISLSGSNFSTSGTYEATFGPSAPGPSLLTGGSAGNQGVVTVGGTLKIVTDGAPSGGTIFNVVGSPTTDTSETGTFSTTNFGSESYTLQYSSTGLTATVA